MTVDADACAGCEAAQFANSPRFVLASLLDDAPGLVPALFIVFGALQVPWLHDYAHWVRAVLALVVLFGFAMPIFTVATHRLTIDDDTLTMRRGLVFPVVEAARLSEISAVQLERGWALHPFGLAALRVSVRGSSVAFALPGLRLTEAQTLAEFLKSAQSQRPAAESLVEPGAPDDDGHRDPARPGDSTAVDSVTEDGAAGEFAHEFRPNVREVAATFVANIVLVGSALWAGTEALSGSLDQVLNWAGVDGAAGGVTWVARGLGVALGAGLAYARLHNLTVSSHDGLAWTVSSGFLEPRVNHITANQVVGFRVRSGPVDALTGTVRVTVATSDFDDSSLGRVRFPAMTPEHANELIERLTRGRLQPQIVSRADPAVWLSLAIVAALVAASVWLTREFELWQRGLLAVMVFLAAASVAPILTGTVRLDQASGLLAWERVGFDRATDYIYPQAVFWAVRREVPVPTLHVVCYLQRKLSILTIRRVPADPREVTRAATAHKRPINASLGRG